MFNTLSVHNYFFYFSIKNRNFTNSILVLIKNRNF